MKLIHATIALNVIAALASAAATADGNYLFFPLCVLHVAIACYFGGKVRQ